MGLEELVDLYTNKILSHSLINRLHAPISTVENLSTIILFNIRSRKGLFGHFGGDLALLLVAS